MSTELKNITVEFVPQAWINDYAVNVDPEGPTTWEVPVEMVRDVEPDQYESDDLRFHENAPEWVKEWSGPFYVTWDQDKAEELLS